MVLFMFDRAGYKVTVIDKSEKDWWKGKCLGGRIGYFPSAYVMRVESGQRTLQVTRNLQLADQITLLRDQVQHENLLQCKYKSFKGKITN